jgi:serine/threonine protein kinase
VHRDLKPSNILLNENYHLVLADFGTAKILKTETSSSFDSPMKGSQHSPMSSFSTTVGITRENS